MIKQKGMTLIGMLIILVMVITTGIVVMQSVPVYIQNYSIQKSIKNLNTISSEKLTGDSFSDIIEMKDTLDRFMDINGIYNFDMKSITFERQEGNVYKVRLKYNVVRHLFYNVNLLFKFDDTIEVNPGSEK